MVFSSFYHGQPLFPKWFCDRKLSFCDGSAETSVFLQLLLLRWKVPAVRLQIHKATFDAALCESTPIHHMAVSTAKKRGLDGASPLDKEKHKALYYNKGNYLKFLKKQKSF